MKSKILPQRGTYHAVCSFSFVFFLLLSAVSIAQNHHLGAILMDKAAYDKLPRPNWDTLRKYSNKATIGKVQAALAPSGVTMLVGPPIGNQGNEGSCVGWAVGYSATGILMYPRYNCWDVASRSPNYVFNQIRQGGSDCEVGSYITDALNLVATQGDCSWNLMPYVDGACTVLPNATQRNDAAQNMALRSAALNTNDVSGMKSALDLGFPVVIGFEVYPPFDEMWRSGGGIWSVRNTGSSRGGHAVCIIGYDDNKQMFKAQNQWGFGGDNGYFWVTYYAIQNYNLLSEAYILYGTNQASPMSVSGDNLVCGTSNNYTISNLPPGATVSWTAPAGLITINSPNAAQTTITQQGTATGTITLTATITVCGGPQVVLPSGPITVGNPTSLSIYTSASISTCDYDVKGQQPALSVVTFSTDGGATWQTASGPAWNSSYHYYEYIAESAVEGPVSIPYLVRATNGCGTTTLSKTVKVPKPRTGNCQARIAVADTSVIKLSPNPANASIVVAIKDMASAFSNGFNSTPLLQLNGVQSLRKINIFDMQGHLVKSYDSNARSTTITIDISTLISGTYFIEVFHNKGVERKKILVIH